MLKLLILFTTLVTFAASQYKPILSSGTFTYYGNNNSPIRVTYIEDENGIRITSPQLSSNDEKIMIEKIKQHQIWQHQFNQKMNVFNQEMHQFNQGLNQNMNRFNQQLNQQMSQLNQQLNQQNQQLNQQLNQQNKQLNQQMNHFNQQLNQHLSQVNQDLQKAVPVFSGPKYPRFNSDFSAEEY